jgi:16S rRNA (adenine1518-N6/adenine1519-N6)-dimethyltransferase
VRPRRRFGQHFLEASWAARIVDAMAPQPGEGFLEIGPGRGALTFPLARRASRVLALEIDRELVEWLRPRVPSNVTVIEADVLSPALDAAIAELGAGGPVRVAGNLPYNISSPILFRLLQVHRAGVPLADATVMLQREVADRLAAGPGSKVYGVLSVAVQMDARVRPVLALPPGAFRPAPKVSSSVVQLVFGPPAAPVDDRATFDALVRGIFAQRRKTLGNALKPVATARGLDAASLLAGAGIDPIRRPETLGLGELAQLANRLASPGGPSVV